MVPGKEMHEERGVDNGEGMDVVSESESEEIGIEDVGWEKSEGLRWRLRFGGRAIKKYFVGGFQEGGVVVCAVELGGRYTGMVSKRTKFLSNATTEIKKKRRWIRRCRWCGENLNDAGIEWVGQ